MTRKAGTISSETRSAILSSALEEFSRYGFQGSSLRRIATDAGVTTGAIYCFFKGKDELFDSVIGTAMQPFMEFIDKHYETEIKLLERNPVRDKEFDYEIADFIINFYYRHKKAWDVLVKHMHHPVVQKWSREFINTSVSHYLTMIQISNKLSDDEVESYRFAITQFVHMQAETITNLICQNFKKKEMLEHSRTSIKMLRGAFNALLED